MKRCAALLLLAACVRSNTNLVADLERHARANPSAAAERLLRENQDTVPLCGEPTSVTLPLLDARMPTVQGEVNGVALPLILDTGASLLSLSGPAARATRLYLPPGPEGRAISPGFDTAFRSGVFESLRLGELRFGAGVAAVPLKDSVGGAYAIVGCSVLGGFVVRFDFKAMRVRLRPGRGRGGPFFAPVRIGGKTYSLLVDSGATRVFLEPWAALELGLISRREAARHEHKSTAFRSGRVTRIRIERIEVAGRVFRDVLAGVVNTFGPKGRRAGLLGLVGFGRLAWTLDFYAESIRVEG